MPDCRQQTNRIKDKLGRARTADPALLVFGAPSHRYEIGPPLDEREVAAFEENHLVSLPACFRAFLTQVGNGSPVVNHVIVDPQGIYPLTDEDCDAFEKNHGIHTGPSARARLAKIRNSVPFDQGYAAGPDHGLYPLHEGRAFFGFESLQYPLVFTPGLSTAAWMERQRGPDPEVQLWGGLMELGQHGCGHVNAIIVRGPEAGRVVGMNAEEWEKPQYFPRANFLDWYETWLDEVLSDSPPRAGKDSFDYRRVLDEDPRR